MKVYLDTIGCRLNQSEIEQFANQFRYAGHTLVSEPDEADLVVVNTCSVTGAAASDSRQKIRQAARAGAARIVVTGCWSTLSSEAARQLPGVTDVFSNSEKDDLVAKTLDLPQEFWEAEPLARQPLPGLHQRTRAFIKVQDGCDNHCTFCITRLARGASRSQRLEQIQGELDAALRGGAQEVVLTGVQMGSWGKDFAQPACLADLIETLLQEKGMRRLRLSSLEPWEVDERLIALWQDGRLCRHLHLPLQAGTEKTLRRMGRNTMPDVYARLISDIRIAVPEMAITTDIIAGFPGETDADFEEGLAFVQSLNLAGGHVFTYSARPGTPAANFPEQVPHPVRKERNRRLREALAESESRFGARFMGQTVEVLWEAVQPKEGGWHLSGWTDHYLRVSAFWDQPRWNQVDRVRIDRISQDEMTGTILGEENHQEVSL